MPKQESAIINKTALHTRVDLLRHGEPRGGKRYRGHLDDPLTELGWAQMRAAVRNGGPWDAIITSSLSRCRAFAEMLAAEKELPLHVEPRFMEMSFGEWEGLTNAQVQARYGAQQTAFWADSAGNPPPGSETIMAFSDRLRQAWDDWTDRLWGQRILLVCHSGVIRITLAHALKLPADTLMSRLNVPYASISQVRLDRTEHGLLSCLMRHGTNE